MTINEAFRQFLIAFHERYPGATGIGLRRFHDQNGQSSYELLADAALDARGERARILDLGCGDGVLLSTIRSRSPSAFLAGIDFTPGDVELARERVPDARLFVGDFTTFPFGEASFDVIVAHYVLMLVGNLEPVLSRVQSALADGGTFAFVVDNVNEPQEEFFRLIAVALDAVGVESATTPFRAMVDHRLYDADALSRLLESFDLTVERHTIGTLIADMGIDDIQEMLLRMYQIGSLNESQRTIAFEAIANDIRGSKRAIALNYQLVAAKRRFR